MRGRGGRRLGYYDELPMRGSQIMTNDRSINIRYGTPADAALLAEIGAQAFAETFAADNTPENLAAYLATAFSPSVQAAELVEPLSCFLIAERGETAIGYARLRAGHVPPEVGDPNAVELQRIYVLKDWLGYKVGAALMQASLEEARTRNYTTIWLGVWEQNPRAIAFYQRWGFEPAGTHVFQLGDDSQTDWIMQRSIP